MQPVPRLNVEIAPFDLSDEGISERVSRLPTRLLVGAQKLTIAERCGIIKLDHAGMLSARIATV